MPFPKTVKTIAKPQTIALLLIKVLESPALRSAVGLSFWLPIGNP